MVFLLSPWRNFLVFIPHSAVWKTLGSISVITLSTYFTRNISPSEKEISLPQMLIGCECIIKRLLNTTVSPSSIHAKGNHFPHEKSINVTIPLRTSCQVSVQVTYS